MVGECTVRTEFGHFWQMTKTVFLARFGKQNPVLAMRWQDKYVFLARFGKKIRFWQSFGNFCFETCLLADFSGDGCGPPLYITVFYMVPLCFFLISDGDATSLVFKFIIFRKILSMRVLATPKVPVLANCGQKHRTLPYLKGPKLVL